MNFIPSPLLDARQAQQILDDLKKRLPAYLPGWDLSDDESGDALARIFARYLEIYVQCLNQAPEKDKLAFFDRLGLDLLPAQPARAPVVFHPIQQLGDSSIPAGARLGAKGVDSSQLVFEVESQIVLTQAKLVEAFSVRPDLDDFIAHSDALLTRQPFTLFDGASQPVPHELYLGDDLRLALHGNVAVRIPFILDTTADPPINCEWMYWDGSNWTSFPQGFDVDGVWYISLDGTQGFSRKKASVELYDETIRSAPRVVNNRNTFWLRAKANDPLLPGIQYPKMDAVSIQSTIIGAVSPDAAFTDFQKLDLTKSFQPFGPRPQTGSSFYFSSKEAFTKIGAKITIQYYLLPDPLSDVDLQTSTYQDQLNQAVDYFNQIKAAADSLSAAIAALKQLIETPKELSQDGSGEVDPLIWYNSFTMNLQLGLAVCVSAYESGVQLTIDELGRHGGGLFPVPWSPYDLHEEKTMLGNFMILIQLLGNASDDTKTKLTDFQKNLESWCDFPDPTKVPDTKLLSSLLAGIGLAIPGDFIAWQAALKAAINALLPYMQTILDKLKAIDDLPTSASYGGNTPTAKPPVLKCEYWNGGVWAPIQTPAAPPDFIHKPKEDYTFNVPEDWAVSTVNDVSGYWVRVSLADGSYNKVRLVSWKDPETKIINFLPILEPHPPLLENFAVFYECDYGPDRPARCLSLNGAEWSDFSAITADDGELFIPFYQVDSVPALYLGFDQPLPAGLVSLFFDIQEDDAGSAPPLTWQGWDGKAWTDLTVNDETHQLTRSGLVQLLCPGGLAPLSLFDPERLRPERTWLRARAESGKTFPAQIRSIDLNAAWASAVTSVEGELLGSSTAQPRQVFYARQSPVLEGQQLEVRELDGARARVELPILKRELLQAGLADADLRVVTDAKTGDPKEVRVHWQQRPHLLFSTGTDRHYVIERSQGKVIFGDGQHGKIPPAGADNIRLSSYRFGGGTVGNVAAGAINQVLSGVVVQSVANILPAAGGIDTEPLTAVSARSPGLVHSRFQAVTLEDYEIMASQASPEVARVRAEHGANPDDIRLILLPHSQDPRPIPSAELRQRVLAYLEQRVPAGMAGHISAHNPVYQPVGVKAILVPYDLSQGRQVLDAASQALQRFLHPLTGGLYQNGWPFGRDIYLSDLSPLLESIEGVDYVTQIDLLVGDVPQGERLQVPAPQVICAGQILLSLTGEEE
jgi:hypothetical protein